MHSISDSPIYRVIIIAGANEAALEIIMADSHEQAVTDSVRLPHSHFITADDVLKFAARHVNDEGEITIISDRVPLELWDDGDDERMLREFVDQAKAAGWTAGAGVDLGSGWITWTHADFPAVHMGIQRMMAPTDPMISPDDAPADIAVRLARYSGLVGAAYRSMPGVAGLAALRNIWDRPTVIKTKDGFEPAARKQPRWRWDRRGVLDPIDRLHGAGDLNWRRNPADYERDMPYCLALDVRAMYLAAAAGAQLGHDAPQNHGAVPFDTSLAGFWRIDTNGHPWARSEAGVPLINPHRINRDGSTWVTTPVLKYLDEIGHKLPEILDSWLSTYSGKWLAQWANQLRDALPDAQTVGDPILRTSIKSTYVQSIAMLSTPAGRIYRPDWTHIIRDEARVRLIRKVHKVFRACGAWPLRIKVDCAWYPTLDDNPARILSMIGQDPSEPARIGQFRLDRTKSGTMTDYLADVDKPRSRRLRKESN